MKDYVSYVEHNVSYVERHVPYTKHSCVCIWGSYMKSIVSHVSPSCHLWNSGGFTCEPYLGRSFLYCLVYEARIWQNIVGSYMNFHPFHICDSHVPYVWFCARIWWFVYEKSCTIYETKCSIYETWRFICVEYVVNMKCRLYEICRFTCETTAPTDVMPQVTPQVKFLIKILPEELPEVNFSGKFAQVSSPWVNFRNFFSGK